MGCIEVDVGIELVPTVGYFRLLDVCVMFGVGNDGALSLVIYLNKVLSSKLVGKFTPSFTRFRKISVLFTLIDFSKISKLYGSARNFGTSLGMSWGLHLGILLPHHVCYSLEWCFEKDSLVPMWVLS